MAENEFTKSHRGDGVPMQVINDAGLNPFGLVLLIESYTNTRGADTPKVDFVFRGVRIQLEIADCVGGHKGPMLVNEQGHAVCSNCHTDLGAAASGG